MKKRYFPKVDDSYKKRFSFLLVFFPSVGKRSVNPKHSLYHEDNNIFYLNLCTIP